MPFRPLNPAGQQFAQGDLPRTDLKSYTVTFDYASKSAKTDYVRVQGNNPPRGGGGIPIQGEQRATEFVIGNYAWNLNPQGEPRNDLSRALVAFDQDSTIVAVTRRALGGRPSRHAILAAILRTVAATYFLQSFSPQCFV